MASFNTHSLAHIRKVLANRSEPEYARSFAELYWRALIILACVIVIAAAIYGGTLFVNALSALNSSVVGAPAALPASSRLNQAQLESTLAGFSARQAAFQALQSGALPALTDPSQ